MATKRKKGGKKKAAPQVVPGSGGREGDKAVPAEKSNVVRTLTAEEGWRFLFIRKGDEFLNEQMEDLNVMQLQAKALRDSATHLNEKADTLDRIAQEKSKRIQAQRELWNATHAPFRKKLNLPDDSRVSHNPETGVFDVVMLPPAQPGPAG